MSHEDLLQKYKPQPRYDTQEAFFADSAEEMTSNPGNQLCRADGEVVAAAGNGLGLDSLGTTYDDGTQAVASDSLGIQGEDYRTQYTKFRAAHPELRNRIYGHARESGGQLWLQYWFWYFYNDYQLAAGFGLHEGDWEMIELQLPAGGGEPELALYAQHAYAESRSWDEVEKTDDGRPVTYPGRGSHASYFAPGLYETEGWYDIVDGKRATPDLELEIVPDDEPGWIAWPGTWGDTKKGTGVLSGVEEPSPTGPAHHPYWQNPEKLFAKAVEREVMNPAQPPPLDATRDKKGELWVLSNLAAAVDGTPLRLLATVNSRDEKGVPPKTFTFDIHDQGDTGRFDSGLKLDIVKHWEVDLSLIVLKDGAEIPTASRCCPLNPGVQSKIPTWVKHPIWSIEQFFVH